MQFCPQLAQGIFMSTEQILLGSQLTLAHTQQSFFEEADYAIASPEGGAASHRSAAEDSKRSEHGEGISNEDMGLTSSSAGGSTVVQKLASAASKAIGRRSGWRKRRPAGAGPIRVGWISRYFHEHPVRATSLTTPCRGAFISPHYASLFRRGRLDLCVRA